MVVAEKRATLLGRSIYHTYLYAGLVAMLPNPACEKRIHRCG